MFVTPKYKLCLEAVATGSTAPVLSDYIIPQRLSQVTLQKLTGVIVLGLVSEADQTVT